MNLVFWMANFPAAYYHPALSIFNCEKSPYLISGDFPLDLRIKDLGRRRSDERDWRVNTRRDPQDLDLSGPARASTLREAQTPTA